MPAQADSGVTYHCRTFDLFIVLAISLAAGTISGIVGFASSIMLMPVPVLVFGPLQAVPIMAISAVMANLLRIVVWQREVDWSACSAHALSGVPAAAIGVRTLLVLPPRLIEARPASTRWTLFAEVRYSFQSRRSGRPRTRRRNGA